MKDFFAVGNDELGELVSKGDTIKFGKLIGKLEYGKNEAGHESNLLGFITVETNMYLVAIGDRLLKGCVKL